MHSLTFLPMLSPCSYSGSFYSKKEGFISYILAKKFNSQIEFELKISASLVNILHGGQHFRCITVH